MYAPTCKSSFFTVRLKLNQNISNLLICTAYYANAFDLFRLHIPYKNEKLSISFNYGDVVNKTTPKYMTNMNL